MQNYVVFINVFFEEGNKAANVERISVNEELHVKLHHKGNPFPLPEWFRKGNCKLTNASMLEYLVSHMHNVAEEMSRNVLSELNKLSYYKPQGRSSIFKRIDEIFSDAKVDITISIFIVIGCISATIIILFWKQYQVVA